MKNDPLLGFGVKNLPGEQNEQQGKGKGSGDPPGGGKVAGAGWGGHTDLIGILTAAVELVGHGQLGVKPPAQHQFEQGELRGGEDRAGYGLELLHVVTQLKLDVLGRRRRRQGSGWINPASRKRRGRRGSHLDIDAAFPFLTVATTLLLLAGGGVRSVLQPQHLALPTFRLRVGTPEAVQLPAFPVPALPAVAVAGLAGAFLQQLVVTEELLGWWEKVGEPPPVGDGQVAGAWGRSALPRASNALPSAKTKPDPGPPAPPQPSPETGAAGWRLRKADVPPNLAAGTISESCRSAPTSPAPEKNGLNPW